MVLIHPKGANAAANGKRVQNEIKTQIRTKGRASSRREAREKTSPAIMQVKEEARREAMDWRERCVKGGLLDYQRILTPWR